MWKMWCFHSYTRWIKKSSSIFPIVFPRLTDQIIHCLGCCGQTFCSINNQCGVCMVFSPLYCEQFEAEFKTLAKASTTFSFASIFISFCSSLVPMSIPASCTRLSTAVILFVNIIDDRTTTYISSVFAVRRWCNLAS